MDVNREAVAQFLPPAFAGRRRRGQTSPDLLPVSRQHVEGRTNLHRIKPLGESAFPFQAAAACVTALQMRFDPFFVVERKLAIEKQRKKSLRFFARHTKSPRLARIFWVARKMQFLSASSDVPTASPISRSRIRC